MATTCGSVDGLRGGTSRRGERVERMVHQEVLLADIVEHAALGISSAAQSVRGANGGSFSCGSGSWCSAIQSAKSEAVGAAHHDVVVDLEVLDEDVEHAPRHVGFDLQQRRRAVAQLLEAAGRRVSSRSSASSSCDHHVGVANDPEEMRARAPRCPGNSSRDVCADRRLRERRRCAARGRALAAAARSAAESAAP